MTLDPSATVPIGGYSLEVATRSGSFAQFEPARETDNARALKEALAEESDRPPAVAVAVEDFEESASEVTGRIERADGLFRAASSGQMLEPGNLTGELDALLDLFDRLDKRGRFDEELKLMRSLNGLLVLALRWLDLVRSLRSLLRSAEGAGHQAGQAWAHHELGSLHLCAGESQRASEHLHQALRIEQELGDLAGRCATRHNLDSARRDLALDGGGGGGPRRLLRLAGLAAVVGVLAGGGTGIALALRDGGDSSATTGTRTTEDTQAPSPPTGLQARAVSPAEIDLVWLASSDNMRVTSYVVYRNSAKLATVPGTATSYQDKAVAAATTYVYTVRATDAARNTSANSRPARATTPAAADKQPPSAPARLRATAISAAEIDLTWSPSIDNVGVTGYVIYRDGTKLTTVPGAATSYQDTSVAPSTGYVYTVQAIDAAGNVSPQSNKTKAQTPAVDKQPPSAPARLRATAISAAEIDLTWSPSIDNVGVTGYVIYRDGTKLTTVPGAATSYQDTSVAPSTGYVYTVQAIDAAGNVSPQSNKTKASTPA